MSDPIVSVDDFGTYLANDNLDQDRAAYILSLAQILCETVVSPLPAGAEVVVLDVAERAYANPAGSGGQPFGLYAEGEGPYNDVTPGYTGGGLWLTENNKALLHRLSGGSSGAFSVDMTPADATTALPWWDAGNWSYS